MTKTLLLKAKNYDDMEKIAKPFFDRGYKSMSSDPEHIIARKKNFGNIFVHALLLFLILFVVGYNSMILYILCAIYIFYFIFNLFRNSEVVLITTESTDDDGNSLEFDSMDDVDFE